MFGPVCILCGNDFLGVALSPCFSNVNLPIQICAVHPSGKDPTERASFCPSYLVGQSKFDTTGPDKQRHLEVTVLVCQNTIQSTHYPHIPATAKRALSVKDNFLSWNWVVRTTVGDGRRWTLQLVREKDKDATFRLPDFCFCDCDSNCHVRYCATSLHCQQPRLGAFRGRNSGATPHQPPLKKW